MPRDAENADGDAGGSTGDSGERLVIVVVRTGGIAGIRRGWEVHPDETEADQWVELVERCPWDEPAPEQPGADRYVWIIRAELADERREREIPDASLDGPWKALVDAVRSAGAR